MRRVVVVRLFTNSTLRLCGTNNFSLFLLFSRGSFLPYTAYVGRMAAKKKKKIITIWAEISALYDYNYDSSKMALELLWPMTVLAGNVRTIREDLKSQGDLTREADLNSIAQLVDNQQDLLRRVAALYEVLEDPTVALAVKLHDNLKELTSKVEQLQDDVNSHERNNEHSYRWNED